VITLYTLTINGSESRIDNECLRNWDAISFSLKRSDLTGVVRSYSTDFEFVGDTASTLLERFLADGVQAEASVSAYTLNNKHGWDLQFTAPLDFTTLQWDGYVLTISALDSALAAALKSKKSTKFEFVVADLDHISASIKRMTIYSGATWSLQDNVYAGVVDMHVTAEETFSDTYFSVSNEISDHGSGANSFFLSSNSTSYTPISVDYNITLRAYFCPEKYSDSLTYRSSAPSMQVCAMRLKSTDSDYKTYATIFEHSIYNSIIVDGSTHDRYCGAWDTLDDLDARYSDKVAGMFGVVGATTDPDEEAFWDENTVYYYNGSRWVASGTPREYYQDLNYKGSFTIGAGDLAKGDYMGLQLQTTNSDLAIPVAKVSRVTASWHENLGESAATIRAISPATLANAIVGEIYDGASVTIDDSDVLLNNTWLLAGESIRQLDGAKIYSTFNNFATWMEVYFGFTYIIDENVVKFVPRSSAFTASVKTLKRVNDVEFSVNDNLIYSSVKAGQAEVDYSEINGRDQWFLNSYTTGNDITDNELSLTASYRPDCYGIEYTIRQASKSTTDNKSDSAVFFVHLTEAHAIDESAEVEGAINDVFGAEYSALRVIEANKEVIATTGAPLTLTLTSSDGNSDIVVDGTAITSDIDIDEALITSGEVKLSTDDYTAPADVHGLVAFDWCGYHFEGYIKQFTAKFGRIDGGDYTLYVKTITALEQ